MNSRMVRTTILAATLGALGCTDLGEPMIIVQNQVPDDGCVISSRAGDQFIGRGIIDVSSTIGYVFTPVIRSLARAPSATENGNNIIFIEGVEVDLSVTGGQALEGFSVLTSGVVQPAGFTGLAVVILPPERLAEINPAPGSPVEVVAEVKVFGTLDGSEVETPPYRYPITVCDGCLQENIGMCTGLDAGYVASTGSECNPLQDGVIECCTSSGGGEVCPAVAETVAVR